MTNKQRDLIRYIEDHGHQAHAHCNWTGDDDLRVMSYDQWGFKHWETIPALWLTVREWLGY